MADQPEALRLAHALEECLDVGGSSSDAMGLTDWSQKQCDLAAAELRRLHSLNAELLEALKASIEPLVIYRAYGWSDRGRVINKAEAAIALATQEAK